MTSRLLPILFAAVVIMGIIALSMTANASPTAPAPICRIEGTVSKITQREAPYQDDEWRKSWNLPRSVTYTDVTINVTAESIEQEGMDAASECTGANLPEERTYQLRNDSPSLTENQKIRALTHFGGDEFSIGNWLYDITTVETD